MLLRAFIAVIFLATTILPSAYASDWMEDNNANKSHNSSSIQDSLIQSNQPSEEKLENGAPLKATVSEWGELGSNNNDQSSKINPLIESPAYSPLTANPHKVQPEVFRNWLSQNHPEFASSTSAKQGPSPMPVLEVKGKWDDADHTLRSFGIHHTTIKKERLIDIPLDNVKVIVVNCAGEVPQEAYQRIRDFVAQGGFLISTDWTVHNLIEHAFPGYVTWNGGKSESRVVDATIIYPNLILCKGVVRRSGWKLDDGSQTIKILRPSDVHVIALSRMLAANDPDRLGILAVIFPFGRGQVLHLVGHFDNNSNSAFDTFLPDPAPTIGISIRQAIACNFLIAGLGLTQNNKNP